MDLGLYGKEYFHDISMTDESDDNYEENCESMRIKSQNKYYTI